MLPKNQIIKPAIRRSLNSDKEWIEAYNTQINRIMRDRNFSDISLNERKILLLLLQKYISIAWLYIFKKHCETL